MLQGRRAFKLVQSPDNDWVLKGMFLPWLTTDMTSECLTEEAKAGDNFNHAPDPTSRENFREHIINMEKNRCLYGAECGIYLLNEDWSVNVGTIGDAKVEALILGWGMCAEYDKGWRVEFARILHLKMMPITRSDDRLPAMMRDLQRRYKVPVEIGWDPKVPATPGPFEWDFSWADYGG